LTYSLEGTGAALFSIVADSGQLQTEADLDHETTDSYMVMVKATDAADLTAVIMVTITVTDANDAPVFGDGDSATRSIVENTDAGHYEVTVSVSDGKGGTASIMVIINVTDDTTETAPTNTAPVFTDGTSITHSIAENTEAGEDIGTPVAATDVDRDESDIGDTLTYSLDAASAETFDIVADSGQLQTEADLDHETTDSYMVMVKATDAADLTAVIMVTITVTDANDAPVFGDGDSATRSIVENTDAGQDIGTPVAATDVDRDESDIGDTLTYSLDATGAETFDIVPDSGQLQTKAALDYETTPSYTVMVSVSDGTLTDEITVTITVTDENDAPVFDDGDSATRSIVENTEAGQDIGTPVEATDVDRDESDIGDTLTYSLDAVSVETFDIVDTYRCRNL
jgi:hypothetical protein